MSSTICSRDILKSPTPGASYNFRVMFGWLPKAWHSKKLIFYVMPLFAVLPDLNYPATAQSAFRRQLLPEPGAPKGRSVKCFPALLYIIWALVLI
jgi:hypothetical protein